MRILFVNSFNRTGRSQRPERLTLTCIAKCLRPTYWLHCLRNCFIPYTTSAFDGKGSTHEINDLRYYCRKHATKEKVTHQVTLGGSLGT